MSHLDATIILFSRTDTPILLGNVMSHINSIVVGVTLPPLALCLFYYLVLNSNVKWPSEAVNNIDLSLFDYHQRVFRFQIDCTFQIDPLNGISLNINIFSFHSHQSQVAMVNK